jgi:hypothetical protein
MTLADDGTGVRAKGNCPTNCVTIQAFWFWTFCAKSVIMCPGYVGRTEKPPLSVRVLLIIGERLGRFFFQTSFSQESIEGKHERD